MKINLPVLKQNQQQDNANTLPTPEMRQRMRLLKDELDGHEGRLSGHLGILNNIHDALEIARYSASCLLTTDPFAAWEKVAERREMEWNPSCDVALSHNQGANTTIKATAGVEKLITRQMRQQIAQAKKRLENYATCLEQFLMMSLHLQASTPRWSWQRISNVTNL